jgi:hypothetical protein
MKDQNKEIIELEEKMKRHQEYEKSLAESFSETHRTLFEELKLKYASNNSTIDYVLGLLRQFLTLSVTGYLGLLVVPPNVLGNVSPVKHILLFIISFCIIFILLFLISKLIINNRINSIVNKRIKFHLEIMGFKHENEAFFQKILDSLGNIKNKVDKKI